MAHAQSSQTEEPTKKGVIATPPLDSENCLSLPSLFKVEKSQKVAGKQTHHSRMVPQAVFVKWRKSSTSRAKQK